ncbi:hypothetical protein [Mycolicibacterium vanbaalenii]|uniref:Uncharacterized protein n=1 Tax=Mycolicibacterium vanbaalenii (strain DSM 7251 / JCM 13017 / BCRC 16820 / KCTC 9966 / NRRL B-24157 / PYR-1) TaxID=350058 RepID=A1THW3_MYCVP|nr:hypothetical protein [Mycolicibacterium vanbaalenii]ABM16763.1 hypothetical protein Mvan_6008 [Mycolicibacterium vanbaalenii PYR-1]MCV7126958.1 hypothetical protein [Mycolicibacterium vanbaalenii PYR-1]
MVDVAFDGFEERWWADLQPSGPTNRPQLVKSFARLSLERFKRGASTRLRIDVEALTNQLNGFAVELVKKKWAKSSFTPDGVRVMQARVKEELGHQEDLLGWARVLDSLGRICDPLAHYVVSHYPPLYDLRPTGLPRNVMSGLKDSARYNACTALRKGLLVGLGTTGPLFESRERVDSFIAALATESIPDAELHEREVILAFAGELEAYARRLAADPWHVLNREPDLVQTDVSVIAATIAETASCLRARYADEVPTLDECAALADTLMTLVDGHIRAVTKQIVAIESAVIDRRGSSSRTLDKLKAQSEHFGGARSSTRDELVVLLSRGHTKTEHDAYAMFFARVAGAERRRYAEKWRKPVELPEAGGTSPQDSVYSRFEETVVAERADLPGGFGEIRDGHNAGEFDAVVALFGNGVTELEEIEEFCAQQWPTYQETAVAEDIDVFMEHIVEIMRWTAIRSGLI